ncbi:MAG: cysteine desulfurase NifS [Candidatus Riflebacteria bacterium]|nr:cysteine desulfurase NifS [Candidatus Riflebacteria bacterium]
MNPEKYIYLDNNATCCVSPEVEEAMVPFFQQFYGNPSSMHSFGGQVFRHIEEARRKVAALLNADPEEIVFTSCGTESDNHAIRGVFQAFPEKRHFITTKVEHPAVLMVADFLEKKGYQVTKIKVDKFGNLDLDEFRDSITSNTGLVSVMAANNETGTLFPIEEIGLICREKGIYFHTDAVQAAGKIPLDVKKIPVDLLSISGHKVHAPKGIGVLYIRRGVKLDPFILGGHQERSRRAGTENVPYIIGLGKACELALAGILEENSRVRELRDKLETGIVKKIPFTRINGNPKWRLPNTCNIGFELIEGESILLHMDKAKIAASSGSACTSGSLEPSHVLLAMDVPFSYVHGSVRFSLSRYNTEEEINYVLQVLPGIIEKLREISPFYTKEYKEKAQNWNLA